ncbi:ATP-binding protein [Rhizobium sp. LjRoot258]|uniref:sensor histidine kinase n=1 Tax=Rhizobium sp. LjRoot258 TaxID=3342299 RepID=UPI003ECDA70D
MKSLRQASIRTQIAVLTAVLAVTVTILGTFAEPFLNGRFEKGLQIGLVAGHIQEVVTDYQNAATPDQQAFVIARARSSGVDVLAEPATSANAATPTPMELAVQVRDLLDNNIFHDPGAVIHSGDQKQLHVRAGTESLVFAMPVFSPSKWIFPAMVKTLALILIPTAILASLSAWLIGRPIVRFAAAAELLTTDDALDEPFQAQGASELRSLATSLNVMRDRIRELVAARTRMLTSISHDLRTPLTRLRMRAERCEQPELRQQMLNDLEVLAAMVDESLAFLNSTIETTRKVELSSLLQTVADDFSDTGVDVSFVGPRRLTCECKPRAIARAVSNVVDNASRHARKIEIALAEQEDAVQITVSDDGPGLSDKLKEQVMEPFFRADKSRSTSKGGGGFGLGLPIAHGIVTKGHGGVFQLSDRQPHGLVVTMWLPRAPRNVAMFS